MLKYIVGVISAALMLAGCQTATDIDAAIQKSAPQLCAAATPLHESFLTVAGTGAISQKTIDREAQAWAIIDPICQDPAHATSTTILIAGANAYIVISQAVREAKAKKASATGGNNNAG
jgi:hypothetical protein